MFHGQLPERRLSRNVPLRSQPKPGLPQGPALVEREATHRHHVQGRLGVQPAWNVECGHRDGCHFGMTGKFRQPLLAIAILGCKPGKGLRILARHRARAGSTVTARWRKDCDLLAIVGPEPADMVLCP